MLCIIAYFVYAVTLLSFWSYVPKIYFFSFFYFTLLKKCLLLNMFLWDSWLFFFLNSCLFPHFSHSLLCSLSLSFFFFASSWSNVLWQDFKKIWESLIWSVVYSITLQKIFVTSELIFTIFLFSIDQLLHIVFFFSHHPLYRSNSYVDLHVIHYILFF